MKICPQCKGNSIIKIKDYQIILSGCNQGHEQIMSFDKFEQTQMIDESKIICDNCKNNNKSISYNKQFYFCNNCNKKLCPVCKSSHAKSFSHTLINYDDRKYECNIHIGEKYNSYCNDCKINICSLCRDEHDEHDIKNFMIPNKKIIDERIKELRSKIDNMNEDIQKVINELNVFMKKIEKYYTICQNFLQNFVISRRNYETLENINNIISNDIISDINSIISNISISSKINKIIEIKNKIDNIEENTIYKSNEDNNDTKSSNLGNEQNLFNKEVQFDGEQKTKLIKEIKQNQPYFSLCYLKKSNMIVLGAQKSIELYDLNLKFINSFNLPAKVHYLSELRDGKIIVIEASSYVKIFEVKERKVQLYKKIQTYDEDNFIGIELENKSIACGGLHKYLSIIEPSLVNKYELKKSILLDHDPVSMVELDESSFLVGVPYENTIIVFSSETYEQLYKIDDVSLIGNNYAINRINNDFVGISGGNYFNGIVYLFSIKEKSICSRLTLDELESSWIITNLNNNYFAIAGKRKGQKKFSDLILFKKGIEGDKIVIKKIDMVIDAFKGDIEGMITINDSIIAVDNLDQIKVWKINTKDN